MVSIELNFKTKPNKNLEFMQAIGSIIVDLRNVKGCIGIDLKQNNQDSNLMSLRVNWQTEKVVIELLESSQYEFLEGAINVLCEMLSIRITKDQKTIIADMPTNKKTNNKKLVLSELKHNLSLL